MPEKIKNILIGILVLAALIALFTYAFITSDFSNLDKARNGPENKLKAKMAKKRYYNTDVEISNDGVLNLGDFEINIGNGQKLIANISLKYKEAKGWGISSGIDDELLSKGTILRHSVIESIMNKQESDVRSYRVKSSIMDNINANLSSTQVEEVYFNKLIVAE